MQEEIINSPRVLVSPPQLDIAPVAEKAFLYLSTHYPEFFAAIKSTIGFFVGLSIPLSVIFIVGIIVSIERLKRIRQAEDKILNPHVEMGYQTVGVSEPANNLGNRWRTAMEHVSSDNPNDWRQGIIEADIILEEMLRGMGYRGDSIGDMLKRVERADFDTLDQAWEAHNVRNRIAHDGSSFIISQVEAKRILALYRQVFEEFFVIS
jgi:hypothetical protein